jgi:hypothetical protein
LAELQTRREPTPLDGLDRVRDVVVLASSSRGGSSMLLEMLRRSSSLVNLQAEVNPFLAIAGLTWPQSGVDSDRLDAGHAQLTDSRRAAFTRELLLDATVGDGVPAWTDAVRARLVADVCWRLVAQWPEEAFDLDEVSGCVREAIDRLLAPLASPPLDPMTLDPVALHLHVLRALRARHPRIDPWFSDVSEAVVQGVFPQERAPTTAPAGSILEEPPFVFARPRRRPTDDELGRMPLVLKAPSNAYRLPFWEALFPHARVRILHLTRNPAASVNGLVDGWLYRGFHAHRVEEPLDILGYSDVRPQDRRYWKYDLPPGWRAWTHRPLVEVCGMQWRSAHTAVLDHLDANPDTNSHRLRFEDVIGPVERRLDAFRGLCTWLGVPLEGPLLDAVIGGLPPIMSTTPPRHRRWFARAEQLAGVLADPAVRGTADRLGYDDPNTWT